MDHESATQLFYRLVWPERAAVLRVALILSGNMATAEDLAQETLLKAFKRIHQFRNGTSIRAWLLTILRNTRIDQLRASEKSREDIRLADLPAEPAATDATDPPAEWDDPQSILQSFADQEIIDALQKTPEEIRWTLLLVDVEGLDHRDAAEAMGVPVGTIKSRLHRGRSMLRAALLPARTRAADDWRLRS